MLIRNRRSLVSLFCGAALALTGCGSSTEGTAAPSAPSLAPDVPAGFDPCTDVPQSVLDSEGLGKKIPDEMDGPNGVIWRGCAWGQPDGYAVGIQTTNITIDMVRGKNFAEAAEFTIGDRKAISTRQLEEHFEESCFVNVEMVGGSLEFRLTNPASGKKTGHLNTCDLAKSLAEKVAPAIPAGS